MDFALSEEQTAIFDMAHAFGQEHIAPFARQWEADGTIPKTLWPQIGELGFGDVPVDAGHPKWLTAFAPRNQPRGTDVVGGSAAPANSEFGV